MSINDGDRPKDYKPLISIIVPVYNVEKYVKKCIISLMKQTIEDIEIICVNDGSTDGSWEIISELAREEQRLILIDLEHNHGQAFARNRGIEAARGEYIEFVDSDDYIREDMVKILLDAARKDDCDIVFCGISYEYENQVLKEFHRPIEDDIERFADKVYRGVDLFVECEKTTWPVQTCWAAIFKRKFLFDSKLFFYEGIVYEDVLFINQCILLAQRVRYINEKPYVYFIRENSTTTSQINLHTVKSHFVVASVLAKFFFENKFPVEAYKYIGKRIAFYAIRPYKFYGQTDREIAFDKLSYGKEWLDKSFAIYSQWQGFSYKWRITNEELKSIKSTKNIILYGAGMIGREAISYLAMQHIDKFIVTVTKAGHDEYLVGNKVYNIAEIDISPHDAVVLLAVSRKNQLEIKNNLIKIGYKNIIAMV